MSEPFPEKPKGMHWKTYQRLYDEHDAAWARYAGALTSELSKMYERLDAMADRGR